MLKPAVHACVTRFRRIFDVTTHEQLTIVADVVEFVVSTAQFLAVVCFILINIVNYLVYVIC